MKNFKYKMSLYLILEIVGNIGFYRMGNDFRKITLATGCPLDLEGSEMNEKAADGT